MEEKGGRRKQRMGGEDEVGGESKTLQQEKTTGIWLLSLFHHSSERLMSPHLRRTAALLNIGKYYVL